MIVVSMLLKDPMTGSMEPRRFRVSSFGGYVYDVDTGRQVSEQLSGMGVKRASHRVLVRVARA